MREKLINAVSFPILPLLLRQARLLETSLPHLLPAEGPRSGMIDSRNASSRPPLRLLAVGESTAVGVGVERLEQAVVVRFAELLAQRTGRAVVWETVGLPGATVSQGHLQLLPEITQSPRDIVLVLFGANDTMARRSAQLFTQDMGALINALRARVGNAAFLVSSVPPLGTFPSLPQPLRAYLGAWAQWLDRALMRLALPGVHYAPVRIDMVPQLFAVDGFHPGALGYQRWAETLAQTAFRLAGFADPRPRPAR